MISRMKSHSHSSFSALINILLFNLILLFIALQPCSSSDINLHNSTPKPGFRIALQHVDSGTQFSSRVHPTITGLEYVMQVGIGTPPVHYNAVINTGADLIWTQCKPCLKCMKQSTPLFDSEKSSSFSNLSCSTQFCDTRQTFCAIDQCTYIYVYNADTYTRGNMATETFTFGCGNDNHFFEDGFGGLMGMGRGLLSLVSQLNVKAQRTLS
ncbi:hypothetical protein POM88_012114 [Heracleum sosnowskyi]|uniref:Peptidase A1 domain-containing protein n=1 Tax=Heracleum sosnowskyi TaxID=360622 RepID=A0AAD8IY32_9APIA|nr:hypothetical protein POM88_012114 [Heracleum sosnowskyi]